MPMYECITVAGTLDADQRTRIADAITTAHVEITGAPFELVHVVFPELPAGHAFTGGAPSTPAMIRGSIRAGRSEEIRHTLMHRIYDSYTEVTGVDPMRLLVAVVDFPPSWAMEGGHILPETTPEAEAAWVAKVSA
ncbi:DNA-binding protein [Mycobacterium sp. MS1601]|uniref:tautomerase family protein n=1 Tax=Mycobacterium sp. MS1601 TaxID=1936029 RepID=UPI00097905DB|nr:tautomerase family protein [Mycobacterium sp. MS1601]AQA06471.1 DNA-binding protein [Mycobacterium sp. MS1601]